MPPPTSSPPPPPVTPLPPVANGTRWSDPATWGGTLPPAGATVVIPAGKTVVLDTATPALRGLTIEGALVAAPDADVAITSDYVYVKGGRLQIGTASQPFLRNATITLTGSGTADTAATPGFGNKVLALMGGTLELHGRPVTKSWTKLNANVAAGARTLTLAEAPGWRAGDQIVISPSTGNRDQNEYTLATIESINGTAVTLREPTRFAHIGQRHAVGDLTFDFRSEVGLLTQNIVVQGDAASTASRVGGHAMFMSGASGATVQIANAQFQRMGQLNQLGRYPIHFHIMASGCNACYVINTTVRDTIQRGIVVHDTSNVRVAGNVVFNTVGHNIVVETPATGGNLIEGNLALVNSMPAPAHTEPTLVTQNDHLPGNFWMKSARNTFLGNVAAGSLSNGFIFDAVSNGPVVFRANVGRNSMAQGRVGVFNFGSGILLMFNRRTHPQDDWSDNVVFHNEQGFWPENEPEGNGEEIAAQDDPGFVIRRLLAVENEMNMVNRGVGMRVHYIEPVIGGSISRPTVNRAFHNQYGSDITVINPVFVNTSGMAGGTDIATPTQSRFRFTGGRFVGTRPGFDTDDGSVVTLLDDALGPRGTYVGRGQQALYWSECVAVATEDGGRMRCPRELAVGQLDVRDGAAPAVSLSTRRDLLRSDGVRYRVVYQPGSSALNGLHGYSVLLNASLSYTMESASAAGYAVRLLDVDTVMPAGTDLDTVTVDVAVPVSGPPRAVHRTGTSFDQPDAPGPATLLRAAAHAGDFAANPLTTYLYDAATRQVRIKASSRWVIVQP